MFTKSQRSYKSGIISLNDQITKNNFIHVQYNVHLKTSRKNLHLANSLRRFEKCFAMSSMFAAFNCVKLRTKANVSPDYIRKVFFTFQTFLQSQRYVTTKLNSLGLRLKPQVFLSFFPDSKKMLRKRFLELLYVKKRLHFFSGFQLLKA